MPSWWKPCPLWLSRTRSVCLSVCLSICLPVFLSACLSVRLSVCLPVCLSVCLSVFLSVCLYVCLSTMTFLGAVQQSHDLHRYHPRQPPLITTTSTDSTHQQQLGILIDLLSNKGSLQEVCFPLAIALSLYRGTYAFSLIETGAASRCAHDGAAAGGNGAHAHTHTNIHIQTHTLTHTHTLMQTYIHRHTHSNTHTDTQLQHHELTINTTNPTQGG